MIYELHVGAFTAAHPDVPFAHRGTYLGLAAPLSSTTWSTSASRRWNCFPSKHF